MAEQIEDAEFWLPSMIFMDDDDTLMENQNLKNKNDGENTAESLTSSHGFPIEFPLEFDYPYDSFSALRSTPVESVVGTAETESSDEEDEFLAGLTRRIVHSTSQKLAVPDLPLDKNEENGGLASSPESTLSVSASNKGGSLVAELKTSKDVPKNTMLKLGENQHKIQNHGFVKNPRCSFHLNQSISSILAQTNHYHGRLMNARIQQQQQMKKDRLKGNIVGKRPSFQVQAQQQPLRILLLDGSNVNTRDSAGTGVFIPRKYDDKPSRSRKKQGKKQ